MGRYLIRRVVQFIPVFFGATFLIYALVFAIPGDPVRALAGERPLPESVQAEIRDQYNLTDPLLVQYGKYMGIIADEDTGERSGVLQLDFGEDFRGRDVSDIMADTFPVTLRLAIFAFFIEAIIGGIAGLLAGLRKGSFVDNLVKVSTISVISIPIFVLAYSAQLLFGVRLGWFPIAGLEEGLASYILPAFVLAATSLAFIARLLRTSLIENFRADYVRTATAKGLPRGRVVGIHMLRNSMIPVVTYLGVDLGSLMGGAIVTESVFNLPGVGRATYLAIVSQEGTVVVGIITALVVVFVLASLLVDVLYAVMDPRIRYE